MKQFIVFLALILVFTSLGVNSMNLARYKQINIALKALAEEIACGGGLMTEGSECTEDLSINYSEADAYAKFITTKAENTPIFSAGILDSKCVPLKEDDKRSIMVTVTYSVGSNKEMVVSRSAIYTWVKQN